MRRLAVLLACISAPALANVFTLEHVIAGGGANRARSACFTLDGTIGQAALGQISNPTFALDAGFWTTPLASDSLFQDGFEKCSP